MESQDVVEIIHAFWNKKKFIKSFSEIRNKKNVKYLSYRHEANKKMFCLRAFLQMWIILIGFPNTNDFVNIGICKRDVSSNSPATAIADLPQADVWWLRKYKNGSIMDIEKFLTYIKSNKETFLGTHWKESVISNLCI